MAAKYHTVGKRAVEITASLILGILPNISEASSTRICRMFVPLTKQMFVKYAVSLKFCSPTTLLSNWFDVKNGKKSWKNQVIAREVLVDCGKKTRVLSTKGDSVTKFPAL